MRGTFFKKFLSLILLLVLAGCAGMNYETLGGHMRAGNCPAAAEFVKKNESAYGKNGRLLFLLDGAQINMLCRNYEESNKYFHTAESLAEDLWTKSVTKEAAAFLLNDYTKPYAGEDFERALINLLSAVNYLMLGQYDEALVECRRLDANLSLFNEKYDEKNVYKEDAFGRYLSGMVYEAARSTDDAFLDYYKAYGVFKDYGKAYGTPMPSALVEDLLRLADATGRLDELKDIRYSGSWLKQSEAGKLGRIVLIHLNGRAPVKEEDKIIIPMQQGPITLAFPRFVATRPNCRQSSLIAEAEAGVAQTAGAELAEDINAIAVKNLDDRKGRVIAKTIARAVVKQAAIAAAAKDNQDLKFLLNVVNIFVERADTRTWRTLPGEIYVSRMFLPEGHYNVYVGTCSGKKLLKTVQSKAGKTEFLVYESMY